MEADPTFTSSAMTEECLGTHKSLVTDHDSIYEAAEPSEHSLMIEAISADPESTLLSISRADGANGRAEFGYHFSLYVWDGEEWSMVLPKYDIVFSDLSRQLGDDSEEIVLSFRDVYGSLPPGRYRISVPARYEGEGSFDLYCDITLP